MTGKKYGEDEKSDIAMRVIADHIRTIAFSITQTDNCLRMQRQVM